MSKKEPTPAERSKLYYRRKCEEELQPEQYQPGMQSKG